MIRKTSAFVVATLVIIIASRTTLQVEAAEIDMLKIDVGPSTLLSPKRYQNQSSLSVSRTNVVAAFYTDETGRLRFYRTSTNGGRTWSAQQNAPPEMGGGQCSGALAKRGGVLRTLDGGKPIDAQPGWFEFRCIRFNDDFTTHTLETTNVHMPGAIKQRLRGRHYVWSWPSFNTGITRLSSGDLMATMYGLFEGDAVGPIRGSRVIAARSSDDGLTWLYRGTVSADPVDPDPNLPGIFAGFTESNIAELANGKLLCIMRSQGSHHPAEYRPLYTSWSSNKGKTWTKPIPTQPQLTNILPTLVVLDNGVVACIYGRPGFHVAFSIDDGKTWQDRVSFSHLLEPDITGQVDARKVGPNRLLAIGGVDDGTRVFPVTVTRVKSSSRATLSGRVVDKQNRPISGARVQRRPNRYAADSWHEGDVHPQLKYRVPTTTPKLGYRMIESKSGYPIIKTDPQGHFRFEDVDLGEVIVTVEADGFAPQHRRIKIGPVPAAFKFRLKSGRAIRGRVVDQRGRPLPGMCVLLDKLHIHSDANGYFHGALSHRDRQKMQVRIHKRYNGKVQPFTGEATVSRIEQRPFVLNVLP